MIIDMKSDNNNWKVGDIDSLPWNSILIKKKGSNVYKHFYSSRYICIREENGPQPGILLKVLGKASLREITMVGDEPFCKDERDDLLKGKVYSSYRFPTLEELTEVLAIVRENPKLMTLFEEASMHFNPNSTFWVREPASRLLFHKKPQFLPAELRLL